MFATLLIILCVAHRTSAGAFNLTQLTGINHGNNLSCTPTNWYDVFIFFLGNYISHSLTINSYPGESNTSVLIAAFGALLIPTTGLIRGINAIARNAKFKHNKFLPTLLRDPDYKTAAAAGALCMVVRKKSWKPHPGDKLSNVILRDEGQPKIYSKRKTRHRRWRKAWGLPYFSEVIPKVQENDAPEPVRTLKVYRGPWTEEQGRYWAYTDTAEEYVHPSKTIHGLYDFKDQSWSYALAHVPRDAIVSVLDNPNNVTPRSLESTGTGISQRSSITAVEGLPGCQTPKSPIIAASYSIPKAVIAMVQLGYAIVTLYQSRGNQIQHYGYAAFALTVVPYAIMSLINLFGNMLTPSYQALYLVGSDVMDEAMRRGAQFDGVVGRLVQDFDEKSARAEVLSGTEEEKKGGVDFSYADENISKIFSVSVVDYSSPPLSKYKRRKYVKKNLDATAEDASACVFIPSCSEFQRINHYKYHTNINRTQMTPQGTFTFSRYSHYFDWRMVICFINAGIILGIIGGVTGFKTGEATPNQLGWILHWYIFGAVFSGFGLADMLMARAWPEPDVRQPPKWDLSMMLQPCVLLVYGIPAIGGFVVVTQMLFEWGTCTFN